MFDWYKLFSLAEFEATELGSRTLKVFLEGIGEKEVTITKGNTTAIVYEDVFLPIEFNDKNPYVYPGGSHSVYLDADGMVWLGFEVEE
jgi:hypothetical protein